MTDFETPAVPFCKKFRENADNQISYVFKSDGLNVEIKSRVLCDDLWDGEQVEKIYYSIENDWLMYMRSSNLELLENESFMISKSLFNLLRDTDFIAFGYLRKEGRKTYRYIYKAEKKDLIKNAVDFKLPILKDVLLLKSSDFSITRGPYNGKKNK